MKKLKFLLASLVFLTLVLVCGQVKASAPTTITDELCETCAKELHRCKLCGKLLEN